MPMERPLFIQVLDGRHVPPRIRRELLCTVDAADVPRPNPVLNVCGNTEFIRHEPDCHPLSRIQIGERHDGVLRLDGESCAIPRRATGCLQI